VKQKERHYAFPGVLQYARPLLYAERNGQRRHRMFKKGLESPRHSEDVYQALRYEMGLAYEQLG